MKSRSFASWFKTISLLAFQVLACFSAFSQITATNYYLHPILACSGDYYLMLKADGTVWRWQTLQAGDESQVGPDSQLTTPISLNFLGAVAVAAGDQFSMILKWDGTVYASGDNDNGQLGNGTTAKSAGTNAIPGLTNVTTFAAGSDFATAVLSNGIVMAWGANSQGQLGIGTTTKSEVPVPVVGLSNVLMTACGDTHTLALDTAGNVWAWGDNSAGELGNGTLTDSHLPVLVTNIAGVSFIAAGYKSSYAITTNGNVFDWGYNFAGQLGLGAGFALTTNMPTQVIGLSNICQISSGSYDTYAIDTSGTLWGWGRTWPAAQGKIPDGSDNVYSPTQQIYLPKMSFLATIAYKSPTEGFLSVGCVDTNGSVQNWGLNGDNVGTPYNTPASTNNIWGYGPTPPESAVKADALFRGSSNLADFCSFVIPLDLQKGVRFSDQGGAATNKICFVTNYPVCYHYNSTNSGIGGQLNLALRIPYQNPIAGFGAQAGGQPLYVGESYRFAIYSGCPTLTNDYPMLTNYDSALEIEAYDKVGGTLAGITNIRIPFYLSTNGSWAVYLTNGLTASSEFCGLKTALTPLSYPNAYGVTNNGTLELSQLASDSATNYFFVIKYKGMNGNGWMSLDANTNAAWQPLYSLDFSPKVPWNIRFLSQMQFRSEPLPPFYYGKSTDELLTNSWVVTNVISVAGPIASYTNVDDSPELWDSPILDNFVTGLKNDPLAIARFVQNQIELTDAIDYRGNDQITIGQLNLDGVNRGALGTFLEREGSPVEQCSLLLYMLRKAGTPAVYVFPPTNGIKMLTTRLSNMLRVQLSGAVDPVTGQMSTNPVVSVNYPWVAAYVGGRWVNIFPWIKDTEVIQGPNLYDYMPSNYDNVMKWLVGYLYNRPEIVGLGDTNDPPEILFPRFVQQQLLTNAPGISFDQLGVQAVNRQHVYADWTDFPTPTWVAGTDLTAESLSDPAVTNSSFMTWNPYIFPSQGIFNTIEIKLNHGTNIFDTLKMRFSDLEDRPFLICLERTNLATDKGLRLKIDLAAYRPSATNVYSFTNDPSLLNNQVQSMILDHNGEFYTNNLQLDVTINRYRIEGLSDTIERTMPIDEGDLNALCLNYGRVSLGMVQPIAQTVFDMENAIQENPSITNSLTVDQYQGPLIYLMGMSYYQKVDHFLPINYQIHFRSPVADVGIGLAKLRAVVNKNDKRIPSGDIEYNQPAVDMAYYQQIIAAAPLAKPQSDAQINLANDNFNILMIADGSAKEHVILNHFFQQSDAISTIRLLQLTNQRHQLNPTNPEMLHVSYTGISGPTNSIYPWPNNRPGYLDPGVWRNVETVVYSPNAQAFVTFGNTTNNTGSYLGTAALILDAPEGDYWATISGDANGGWGEYFPDDSFQNGNLANMWLNSDDSGDYSVSFSPPSLNYQPLPADVFDPAQTYNLFNSANNDFLQFTPFNAQWAFQSSGYLGGGSGSLNGVFANDLLFSRDQGFLGWTSDGLGQSGSAVKDPVHVVTGEFYVDTVDLTLVGPMPLEIRRNYSSLNLADNEFGIGWKMSFTPYISMATNGLEMYAAEPDGSVLAYVPSSTNVNLWLPNLSINPQLVNNRRQGIGSTANLMLTQIVQTNQSGNTNYYLYSPNGDTRFYQERSYLVYSSSNILNRTRPYLTSWQDARGNSLTFTIGTNSQATDYGQLARVDSSSGAYIQFTYDVNGHILSALANDGREVDYQYDDYGDLVTVALPDASEFNYEYTHGYQPVTNSFTANSKKFTNMIDQVYSLHLLTTKTDPDGRILENVYDSQRRVTNQISTVGPEGELMTNATFVYANNFVLTNSFTNTISGYTLLSDVFGNVTRYNYTNSRITLITDPLNQTVEQDWFDENTNFPGYYPRSLYRSKDKRGLWTYFMYDSSGNVTNRIVSGNLIGSGSQTATNVTYYNSNNLPVMTVDAIGNSNLFYYDSAYTFLLNKVVACRGGQAITTNLVIYGNVTNVVTFGSSLWTNQSFGLPQLIVRDFGSLAASSNQWVYNGSGFLTNEVDFTSTGDPAITNVLFYDGRGELYKRIDAAGRRYQYDYDGLGRPISEERFEAGTTIPMFWQNLYYNHNGDITWYDGPQYNPEDYIWFDYDGAGRKTAEVDWRSQASPDGSGVQSAPDNALYSTKSYSYDGFGNLMQQTEPVGNYSLMAYDQIGQMTRQVFYDANNNSLATNAMSYEAGGLVASLTNSLGGVTQTLYTQLGKPFFRLNPDGSTNGWQYDLLGRVKKEFVSNGSYWQTIYDDANRKVIRQFCDSGNNILAVTTNIFDARGNLITNVTAQGGVFVNVYDGQNRLKTTAGPPASGSSAQQSSSIYYDGAGVYVTNLDSVGRETVITYDASQRPIATSVYDTTAGGALVAAQTTGYSSDYHSVTMTAGTGTAAISKTTFLDSFNQPVLMQSFPNSTTTNYSLVTYDLAERVAAAQDELGQTSSFSYDGLGRVATNQLPDGATTTSYYNGEGGLTRMVMPGGLTWTASYNVADQKIGEQLASGSSVERQLTNFYHANGPYAGLLQSTVDQARWVTNSFTYDAFDRVSTEAASGVQAGQTLATTYEYDAGGVATNYTQVPVQRQTHQELFNSFWRDFNGL